jgi:tRNA (guanine-N7-)-methyltransferase
MANKNKLKKFSEILSFPNVAESYEYDNDLVTLGHGEERRMKGRWAEDFFKNNNPICLELACGKGEYSLGLGRMNPDVNYLGLDIKGNRIWKGASRALDENLTNVGFFRTRIERLTEFFKKGEFQEVWILFPDPFSRKSKANKRLTSPRFLDIYHTLMPRGSSVHLKTDDPGLYAYSLESIGDDKRFKIIENIEDIYAEKAIKPELKIRTFYEESHLKEGRTIYYIRAVLV